METGVKLNSLRSNVRRRKTCEEAT